MPIEITMPRLSDTMEAGTIIKWNVKEGDSVSAGEAIADIETDKATMEMQVYDAGTVARILVNEGQTVDIGTPIALLVAQGETLESAAPAARAESAGAAPAAKRLVDGDGTRTAAPSPAATGRAAPAARPAPAPVSERPPGADRGGLRVSPVARQLAEAHGVDLQTIQGSGPSGRIIKRDVMHALETGRETAAAIAPSGLTPLATPASLDLARREPGPAGAALAPVLEDRIVPLSNMRQIIARRLVESKTTIPHYQVTVSFDMDPLLDLRRMLNEQLEAQGVKLSVNDFIVRGCALAMHEHPEFNASWGGDSIRIHGDVNVGVAIALPPERGGGLVVATIRQTDRKSLRQISAEVRHLAERARTRGLTIEEMADATFTISNLGMFGVDNFTAIINPPNSAILAVGAALERPVVRHGALTVGHEMSATLSLDHRVIDGATGARYLQSLKAMVEHPSTLLV